MNRVLRAESGVVPEIAMKIRQNGLGISSKSKAKEGKRKISIVAGISNGSKTEVLSGLKENDQVVLQ